MLCSQYWVVGSHPMFPHGMLPSGTLYALSVGWTTSPAVPASLPPEPPPTPLEVPPAPLELEVPSAPLELPPAPLDPPSAREFPPASFETSVEALAPPQAARAKAKEAAIVLMAARKCNGCAS
jgi:hypothetical protein